MRSRDVVNLLEDAGFMHKYKRSLLNNLGKQIFLESGAIINLFKTGQWNVQGKVTPRQKAYLEAILGNAFKKH
jgi:hypothetical protein